MSFLSSDATSHLLHRLEEVADAPQQSNGSDCGMYVCGNVERLLCAAAGLEVPPLTPAIVSSTRRQLLLFIQGLKK